MSEHATEEAVTETQSEQVNPDEAALGDAGKKALDRMKAERNEAKQSAATLQKQLDELNAANLSDLEKAQKAAQDAQESAARATTDALRYRIAAESGIRENADLILTAPDEDTMRKQASLWADRAPSGPKPDLSQGGSGEEVKGSTANQFAAALSDQLN